MYYIFWTIATIVVLIVISIGFRSLRNEIRKISYDAACGDKDRRDLPGYFHHG